MTENNVPAVVADNSPAAADGGNDIARGRSAGGLPDHERHIEYVDEEPSMGGGYASVKDGKCVGAQEFPRVSSGKTAERAADGKLLWITVAIMSLLCVIIAVCTSLLTAHFMKSGESPPVINSGNIQQNIAAVVNARKPCIAEVSCGGMRGSAIVTKRDGQTVYALTNAHVIKNYTSNGTLPLIRFYGEDGFYGDDGFYPTRVIGYDEYYDIAVIAIEHKTLYTVYDLDGNDALFDPELSYNDGDYVVSIGNAMGFGIAAYDGIISRSSELLECDVLGSSGKKFVPVLRTTAVINAGMSGGGLFDMSGRLVGMGTYRMSNSVGVDTDGGASTDVEDTGFVTPISVVYSVYKRILNNANGGDVGLMPLRLRMSETSAIGFIGMPFGFSCEYRNGALTVVALDLASPNKNVKDGDVITHINGKPVTSDICATVGELLKYNLGALGDALTFTVKRGGSEFGFTVDNYRYAI